MAAIAFRVWDGKTFILRGDWAGRGNQHKRVGRVMDRFCPDLTGRHGVVCWRKMGLATEGDRVQTALFYPLVRFLFFSNSCSPGMRYFSGAMRVVGAAVGGGQLTGWEAVQRGRMFSPRGWCV
jgi:hypothetical protein